MENEFYEPLNELLLELTSKYKGRVTPEIIELVEELATFYQSTQGETEEEIYDE
jgi:hypothetical protein